MNIYEFARQKELEAEALYRDLAKNAPSKGMKSIFSRLAEAEKRHFETVGKLERGEDADLSEFKTVGDAMLALKKMTPSKEGFNLAGPQVEVYREALRNEAESEKYYRDQARETKNAGRRRVLLTLAEEEYQHFSILDEIIWFVGHPEAGLENAEFVRTR